MRINVNNIIIIPVLLFALSACHSGTAENNNPGKAELNYSEMFFKKHENKPEPIYPIEYYENEIIKFQKILPESRNINIIKNIENIIPGSLCFLVGWNDFNVGRGDDFDIIANSSPRGNFFGLYSFDTGQRITNEYLVGYKNYLDSIRNILFEKVPGYKPEYGLISAGDFNNDRVNEIASIYLHPPRYEYVFTVFGFDVTGNDFIPLLLAPVFINFDTPFPPVEYNGNGFRVLEILEYEPLELAWNNYTWNESAAKYSHQK